jgi:APA family basic amino acid/polyamine antiporter
MQTLKEKIGFQSAVFLVVSVIIGSGVFKKVAPMSAELGSPYWVILCWILAGLISLAGALSTAEMSSMFPNSGGEYFYFQKLYGRFFAFLYGWSSFTIIKTAAISALAYIFAQSFNKLFPLPVIHFPEAWKDFFLFDNFSVKALAAFTILMLTMLNHFGVRSAERLTYLLSIAMMLGILLFIGWGFFSSAGELKNITQTSTQVKTPSGWNLMSAMMTASLGAFWGYEGWNNVGYIGEEIKNPKRNLPRAFALGTIIVIFTYVMLNIDYLYVMPIDGFIGMKNNPNSIAAIEVAGSMAGEIGMTLVACLILTTTLNSNNSSVLLSARMIYALSRDGLFLKKASAIHPKYNTPHVALWIQAIWAIVLLYSGTFDQLTDMLVFAAFLFYGSTALGVIIMRIKHPEIERQYKVIGYPYVPGLFVLFCLGIFLLTIINQPKEALWGLALILSGVPVYWWMNRKKIS